MFTNYILATLSILLYLHGFFPIPSRPLRDSPPNNVTASHPVYNKAVLIVIDALRLDFVTKSTTPFIAQTFHRSGCFITLKVETPTVTLPRIKALTTGNVPQFVDIILNLASPTTVEDSFIHRAHAKGKKILFYGDDIWVKLFPGLFLRSEGTSSFFVNDFKEVDDNVTRNVKAEMDQNDWDLMILHYLGLDHIGHVYGPKSPLILTKLLEMDKIVEDLYREDTLIIITGDHGMRDSGGHGGSTQPETSVPLVILNMPCKNDSFAQIDLPANLAILLGFDIPSTSIGRLHRSFLQILSPEDYLKALEYNANLLRSKLDLCPQENSEKCSEEISEALQKSSVEQNLGSLIIATLVIIILILNLVQSVGSSWQHLVIFAVLLLQFVGFPYQILVVVLVALLRGFSFNKFNVPRSFLSKMSVVHPFIFISSSFVEEENEFWYFFMSTFVFINIFTNECKAEWTLFFAMLRFIRTINQVGDKWASLPDLSDWLLQPENGLYLKFLFAIGLLFAFYSCTLYVNNAGIVVMDSLIFSIIYVFRMVANEDPLIGKVLWCLILLRLGLQLVKKQSVLSVWILVVSLLLKPTNTILIPVCVFASRLFQKTLKSDLVIAHWWLGNLLCFAQGHDNSLASVDISSGYIGLTQYFALLVIPQVLCHTYALPVLSHLLLFTTYTNQKHCFQKFVLLRLVIVLSVFVVTFVQRHHLFIWSVFAPKMFVEASHFGFLFIEVCCFYLIKTFT